MKFLATALLAFVAATEAARSATTQKLRGTTIRDGPSARKLLEKAVKVDRHGQRVLSNNDFQVTSSYSLKFDTCVSLKTEPSTDQAIIFDDALIEYTTKGEIIPQKSYILFDVCETKYCDMYAKGDNMYMIDLSTYMYAFSEYYLQRQEAYCVACADSTDYCT